MAGIGRLTRGMAAAIRAIPKLPGLPYLGAPWRVLRAPGAYLLEGHRRFGPVVRFDLFGMPIVALLGVEANHFILVSHRESFSHAEGYRIVRDVLGDGLLFQDGEVHRRNRTLMTPAFHQRGVAGYFDTMLSTTRQHLARWALGDSGRMYDRFRHLTFEIMARLVLGVSGDIDLARLSNLNDELAKGTIAALRAAWRWTSYGRALQARDALREYLRSVIRVRLGTPGDDALGLLIAARDEHGDGLSQEEILEQAVILMFAGHETTTSMLSSLLLVLRDRPDILERLREEQVQVLGSTELTSEALKGLRYLDCVMKEVERLFPPVSVCQRRVVREVEFAGHQIPVGTYVMYSPWVTHRLAEVYAEPDRIDPDRFAVGHEGSRVSPYALVGFGGGPRLCIGQAFALMEAKVVATELLRHYDVELMMTNPAMQHVPTLHPRSGLPGFVRARGRFKDAPGRSP